MFPLLDTRVDPASKYHHLPNQVRGPGVSALEGLHCTMDVGVNNTSLVPGKVTKRFS